jgi:hypothetical protein
LSFYQGGFLETAFRDESSVHNFSWERVQLSVTPLDWPWAEPVLVSKIAATRMHVFAENLTHRQRVQLGLFEPSGEREAALARVKEAINARHGRFAVRSGTTLWLPEIYRDSANEFDICDIRVRWDSHRRKPSPREEVIRAL